jgi:hypothetical protein
MPKRVADPSQASSFYVVDFQRAAPLYASLPQAVRAILRLCDGTRGLEDIVRASPLGGEPTRAVVRRLEVLGVVWRPADRPFSRDEEAFFAQTIDHLIDR